jgi:hypothetical protein
MPTGVGFSYGTTTFIAAQAAGRMGRARETGNYYGVKKFKKISIY